MMFGRLQDDARALIDAITALAYFMRGGATFTELMNMPYGVRERMNSFIEHRLEIEKKNPNPVY